VQEALNDLKSRVDEGGKGGSKREEGGIKREEGNDGVVVKGEGVREWKGMEAVQVGFMLHFVVRYGGAWCFNCWYCWHCRYYCHCCCFYFCCCWFSDFFPVSHLHHHQRIIIITRHASSSSHVTHHHHHTSRIIIIITQAALSQDAERLQTQLQAVIQV
jgi:hypothetical protein